MVPFDPSKVHGLKPINPKRVSLPIRLSDDQRAFTCMCGSGWLTVTGDEVAAREAFKAHIEAA